MQTERTVVSKLDNALSFQQQALNLRAHRQQVLAANIANADTPHFKARDIDFAAALKDAVAGRGAAGLPLARSSERHLAGTDGGPAPLLYRKDTQSAVDGNTVDMDIERSQFAENAVHYESGITFITHQLRMMTAAMQNN
jgi:flagellar basal-body rod protein FlgB